MGIHQVDIASPPDREKLVAQICVDHEMWAEVNQETSGELRIELYPRSDGAPWTFPLNEMLAAIDRAKERLTGEKS